jgi:hypothetical protein
LPRHPEDFMPRLLLTCAIFPALLATQPVCAQALEGWSGYKFGMSPDAARAVPGMIFGPYSAKNLMNQNVGAMGAKKNALVNGLPYVLDLFFDSSQKLNEITLDNEKKASQPDCEKTFLTLLGQMEKIHGGFSPVTPQRQKNNADTPPASVVWKSQGASRYELATLALDDETASAWKARKTVGANSVEIAATWSGKEGSSQTPCVMAIDYRGK